MSLCKSVGWWWWRSGWWWGWEWTQGWGWRWICYGGIIVVWAYVCVCACVSVFVSVCLCLFLSLASCVRLCSLSICVSVFLCVCVCLESDTASLSPADHLNHARYIFHQRYIFYFLPSLHINKRVTCSSTLSGPWSSFFMKLGRLLSYNGPWVWLWIYSVSLTYFAGCSWNRQSLPHVFPIFALWGSSFAVQMSNGWRPAQRSWRSRISRS